MTTMRLEMDGEKLRKWQMDGFSDELVLVIPCGGECYEVGIRVMEMPSHTAPTDPPRAATLDEAAEVAGRMVMMACRSGKSENDGEEFLKRGGAETRSEEIMEMIKERSPTRERLLQLLFAPCYREETLQTIRSLAAAELDRAEEKAFGKAEN